MAPAAPGQAPSARDSRPADGSLRKEYLGAAAALGFLLVIFFSPVVRGQATFSNVANIQRLLYPWAGSVPVDQPEAGFFPQADQATYFYPRHMFLEKELDRGHQVPLWNPLSLAGSPLFAETGSRLAYPPFIVLTLLLPPTWTHDVYIVLHLFVAGMAAFALMKQLGTGFAGALLTGIAWMLSSYTLSWVMLETFAAVAAMLPLALLFVRRWHDNRSWLDLGLATVALGFMVLGSTVDVVPFAFAAVLAYACALAVRRVKDEWAHSSTRQRLGVAAAPLVLAVGAAVFAAPAILPFLQLSERSARTPPPLAWRNSVPTMRFFRAFLPPSIPSQFDSFWRSVNGEQTFAGTLTAGLALAGLVLRRPGAGLGRGLVGVSFVFLAFPTVQRVVGYVVPLVSSSGRGLFVWNLGVAVLGGLGLDILMRRLRAWKNRPGVAFRGSTLRVPHIAIAGLLAIACLVITSGQLLSYGRQVNPPFQRRADSQLFPTLPVIDAAHAELGEGPGRGRVLGLATLAGSTSMAVDLPAANGYANVVPAEVGTLWRTVAGESPAEAAGPTITTFQTPFDPARVRTDLLGRVGVTAVLAPPAPILGPGWDSVGAARRGLRPVYTGADGTVFAVMNAAPRALVVENAVWVRSSQEALLRFTDPSFDVRRELVLQGAAPPLAPKGPGTPGQPAARQSVTWLQDDPNRLRLSVTTARDAWLVVLDNWDPDWVATVGGRDVDVRRADFGFRAVRVPAGTSAVTFTYRPRAAIVGASLSLLASTGIIAAVMLGWSDQRRRSGRGRRRGRSAQPNPDRVPVEGDVRAEGV